MIKVTSNKIKKIDSIITESLSKCKKPYISCSFGKDSTVMLWRALQINSNLPVVFMNSGYYLPDIYAFRDYLISKWDIKNYVEINSNIDYMDFCKNHGLYIERKQIYSDKKSTKKKKDRFNEFAIKNGYDSCFVGVRADESKARTWMIKKYGHIYTNRQDITKIYPLAYCKINDIWDIINENNLPYCEIYDKTGIMKRNDIRSSGWLTTIGAKNGKILWLKKYYPEYFNKLQKEFPIVRSYI